MNLEYMCSAVVVSNICVHQYKWVCRHQHRTGARRRQIRLERIRHKWSTCSIFPDCHLWIENSDSFHHLSSAWIPEDINAAIAACFVFAINPFIVTHTHWQWVSALVPVIYSHRVCLLHLKGASAHGMRWLFSNFLSSFYFPLKSATLQHLILLFRHSQKEDLKSRDSFSICSWSCLAAPASCWASI